MKLNMKAKEGDRRNILFSARNYEVVKRIVDIRRFTKVRPIDIKKSQRTGLKIWIPNSPSSISPLSRTHLATLGCFDDEDYERVY